MEVYDFEGLCSLWAAVFKRAYRDAKRGSEEAANYLDYVVPEWREVARQQEAPERTEADVVAHLDNDGAIVAPGHSCEAVQ